MGTNLSTSMMNSLSLSVLLLCTAAASSVASSLDEFTELSAVSKCPGEGPRYGDYKCNHDQTHRVCARLKDAKGVKKQWGSGDFWAITQQPDCSATDVSYVMTKYTDGGTDLAPARTCLNSKCG